MFLSFAPVVAFALSFELVLSEACHMGEVENQISSLKKLVNLLNNKKIFSSLLNCDNDYFDITHNVLGTLDFTEHHSYHRQPYVANGYFGARIPNIGHGFAYDLSPKFSSSHSEDLKNGWPLFNQRFAGAFAAGFFDSQPNTTSLNFPWLSEYGWDSFISAIPQWTYLSIASNNFMLDPANSVESWGHISNYVQNLSLENGIVSTLFTWLDTLHLRYEVAANKHDINSGCVSLIVSNPSNASIPITARDLIDFKTSQRCEFISSEADDEEGIQIIVTPLGISDIFGAVHSRLYLENQHSHVIRTENNGFEVKREIETIISPGETLRFVKLVGVFTTDLDPKTYKLPEDVSVAAKNITLLSKTEMFLQLHKEAWLHSIGNSSVIEFPDSPLLTMTSRASVYHINANMREEAIGSTSALSVSGLSSDSYGGQIFWDTDLWMLMGILSFNPLISKSLLNYRTQRHEQALKNTMSESRPRDTLRGAIYPWTSGRFGNCTATGPCFDYEYHVNAAIAHSAIQIYLSGLVDDHFLETVIYPIVYDAASFFSTYVEYDDGLSRYITKNLTDPDEFAEHVDNGAYTNAAISMTIKWAIIISRHLGKSFPQIFQQILDQMYIPYSPDERTLVLEYSGMNSSIAVKQADVIMMTYPLENELITEELAIHNLMYYATKQVSTGPAMTFLIFSIVSSALLDKGCSSESYLLKSIVPFLRGPFAQFLEQSDDNWEINGGTHPAFPFLTAHGGFLQTILMGLLGMRFSYELEGDKIERVLTFKARNLSLFPQGVSFGEIQYLNSSLSIELGKSQLTIKNNGPIKGTVHLGSKIRVILNSTNGIQEMKMLEDFESVSFIISARDKSDSLSITECGLSEFFNLSPGTRGDVPDLMHDGDNSTFWQAESSKGGQVLIYLDKGRSIQRGYINWGDIPARWLEVYAHQTESAQNEFLKMEIQQPANADFSACESIKTEYSLDNNCRFHKVFADSVQISEPFDLQEYSRVQIISRHNITRFELPFPIQCNQILIRFCGSYGDDLQGAKIFNIELYEE